MNDIKARIEAHLSGLEPLELAIEDDSGRHAGHKGANGGGHYRLRIVSTQFRTLSPLARHRLIHAALEDLMGNEIHALAIRASTPEEVQPIEQ